MEDETLTNILNLLQNNNKANTNNTNNHTPTLNNDVQTLLIKFLLSGGLNQFMNFNQNNNTQPATTTETPKVRTINLKNYQRLD